MKYLKPIIQFFCNLLDHPFQKTESVEDGLYETYECRCGKIHRQRIDLFD